MPIVCPTCKANVSDGSKFCINCGARLSVICPNCKKTVIFDTFCENCGAAISQISN